MPQKQSEPGLCSFFILIINLKKVSEEVEDWKLLETNQADKKGGTEKEEAKAKISSQEPAIKQQGVLHGDTELQNILWNDIVKCLIIVDFGQVSIRFCWWTKRRTAPSFLEQPSAKMLVHGLVRKMTITGHLWLVDWNVCSKF
ncbi:uncharacterized protein CIMG_07375 [Coccidioides immitis RS]|uniref:Uncharacterized protein n=1 Tax=Coccidioides immitis (strain RS) TaxID=246410 RepID=J3KA77_COCIM|nr:uncharacterized protein CIMG_07375 [Coccidioides immitis RS]EAS31896.3 hypothetical protein CIMG_07375 [Coccidioides immitis RS]